ncbi:MAG: aminotransferase class III-fold pyridoxal phosphate-dependent enzyme [Bacteroidota bacterium]
MFTEKQLFYACLAQTSPTPLGIEICDAEGVFFIGKDAKKYYDLIAGVSVSNAGHKNPAVVSALHKQLDAFSHLMVFGELIQAPQTRFAAFITSLLPQSLNNVYFVNSGAEAIEGAMKLAKRYTGRTEIVAFKNAYHGSTQGALSIMGNECLKQPFRPLLPDVRFLNFNAEADLLFITEKTACVVVEPVQGEAGIVLPVNDFLKKLSARCQQTGTLLVFDEVQTGICRTGPVFAFEHYQVVPDVLVLAKALGGGMPLGAFVASRQLMSCLASQPALGHITTFGGHPVSCAGGLAAFEYLTQEVTPKQIEAKADLFYTLLVACPHVKEIRYLGLLMAVELGDAEKLQRFVSMGVQKGFISDWFLFCDTAFRISPPLTISHDEIRDVCRLIGQVLERV